MIRWNSSPQAMSTLIKPHIRQGVLYIEKHYKTKIIMIRWNSTPQAISVLIKPHVPQGVVVEFLWQHLSRDLDVLSRAIGRSPDDAALTIHCILAEITSSMAKREKPVLRFYLS